MLFNLQKMVMAPVIKVILALFAFIIFWILAVFPAVPFLPIGSTAGSLLGATLMVLFQVTSPAQAYEAIDLSILALLFGTMLISVYLERADAIKYMGKLLSWRSKGPKDLICRICLIAAITSACFTNDTSCMVLTEFVYKIAMQHNLPPEPLLLALASSANIGSAATPIGNPQNLVIAIESGISFGEFIGGLLPAALTGIFLNALVLVSLYWKLSAQKDEEDSAMHFLNDESVNSYHFSPDTLSHLTSEATRNYVNSMEHEVHWISNGTRESRSSNFSEGWIGVLWKSCVYLIIIGMLISLLLGQDMSWTAITAALMLVVLDFQDARPCLDKVPYSLLLFFCGMFITVDGLNRTGVPSSLWDSLDRYTQIDNAQGVAVVALVIVVLSNLISNVPTVLLLGGRMAASAGMISPEYEKKAWLILAWASTVAGNLSLVGSAANLIVCDQARCAAPVGYTLTFWNHLKFGLPSTIIVTSIGLTLIQC